MTRTEQERIAGALLDRYGHRSLAEEAEINLQGAPHSLYQLLQLAALADARTGPGEAVRIFTELRGRRWSTAGHMVRADPAEVSRTLTAAGLPESDSERITTAMRDAALHLQEDHGGDLGELREDAGRDPERERALLRHFAGVDDTVVDAFVREAQLLWTELMPFADKKALDAAARLELDEDAAGLRGLAGGDREFVRLVDALVRIRHERDGYREIRDRARSEGGGRDRR
ncbi:hypothetical protein [Streptomyces aidingensis]|uniref:Endonuclease III n=1 Tax=Streptomyces aidingensis TaxID=910347 RepID=A0A1I1SKW2_9ACTN|nr:hypothetical protein [Streptomyces aidingensis]SFD47086.1 hypothetical protein SAMN05421773_11677 [Streptomyces aidingensis]